MNEHRKYRVGESVYAADVVIAKRPVRLDRATGKWVPDEGRRMLTSKMAEHLGLKRDKTEDSVEYDERVWAAWCEYWHPLDPVSWTTKKAVKASLQKPRGSY